MQSSFQFVEMMATGYYYHRQPDRQSAEDNGIMPYVMPHISLWFSTWAIHKTLPSVVADMRGSPDRPIVHLIPLKVLLIPSIPLRLNWRRFTSGGTEIKEWDIVHKCKRALCI